jgi:hypothetical protein
MLPGESLLTPYLIAFAFLLLEWLARISMLSAWTPVTSTRGAGLFKRVERCLGRFPKLPTLEPLHLCVGMSLLQASQSGQKVFAIGCAERCRQPASENRPVRISGWHVLMVSKSLEFFDERRSFDMQEFRRAISITACSIQRSFNEIPLNRSEIPWQIEAFVRQIDERSLR